jgi:hypothetical protein
MHTMCARSYAFVRDEAVTVHGTSALCAAPACMALVAAGRAGSLCRRTNMRCLWCTEKPPSIAGAPAAAGAAALCCGDAGEERRALAAAPRHAAHVALADPGAYLGGPRGQLGLSAALEDACVAYQLLLEARAPRLGIRVIVDAGRADAQLV